jgi:hypothetical protein
MNMASIPTSASDRFDLDARQTADARADRHARAQLRRLVHLGQTGMKCTIACEVKPKDHEYGFDPDKRVDHKVQRQVDPCAG